MEQAIILAHPPSPTLTFKDVFYGKPLNALMEDEHLIEHENLYKTKIMVIFLFNAAEMAAVSSSRKLENRTR